MALGFLSQVDPHIITVSSGIPGLSFNRSDLSSTITLTQNSSVAITCSAGFVATSYNGLTVTANAGNTLNIANNGTLATTGAYSITLNATAGTIATLPSGTVTLMATTTAVLAAQMPALTGDVTTTAGTIATTLATTQGAIHTWSLAQTFTVPLVFSANTGGTTVGQVWNDSVQKTLAHYCNGVKQFNVGCLFTQVSTSNIVATTATSIVNTTSAIGTPTLPANFLMVGKVIRIKASGIFATTTTVGTILMQIFLGSTGATASAAIAPAAISTTYFWELEATMTCRSTTTYSTSGIMKFYNSTTGVLAFCLPVTVASTALVVTNANLVDVKITQTQAGTFSSFNFMIEALA